LGIVIAAVLEFVWLLLACHHVRTVDMRGASISHGKISSQAGRANRSKTNSCSEATKNAELRTGEHLTPDEVGELIEAAKGNRQGHRNATMILLTYRHGLRAAEVCDLRWDQVDFNCAVLHVRRVKNGTPSTHILRTCACG
jgi:integrase